MKEPTLWPGSSLQKIKIYHLPNTAVIRSQKRHCCSIKSYLIPVPKVTRMVDAFITCPIMETGLLIYPRDAVWTLLLGGDRGATASTNAV